MPVFVDNAAFPRLGLSNVIPDSFPEFAVRPKVPIYRLLGISQMSEMFDDVVP